VFCLCSCCPLHLLRRYSYTPTYPTVLTIVHLDGTSILSLYNNITPKNIYNWDEKGFLIGLLRTLKRIMLLEAYKSGQICQAAQDGNCEFISPLTCVSAIGRAIPATFIYKGKSHDLQDT
jgi:hypothetical protein